MKSCLRVVRLSIVFLLSAVVSTAGAQEEEAREPPSSIPRLRSRDIQVLREQDTMPAPDIYVDAQNATVLRFEAPMSPVEVTLPDWQGRFEKPLAHGRTVLLVPLVQLHEHERIPLTITLQDGTRVPFSLVASPAIADQQVNVLLPQQACMDLRQQLRFALQGREALQEQLRQYEQERRSPEHALAVLLSDERAEMLFKPAGTEGVNSAGTLLEIKRFQFETLSAVLFIMHSTDPGLPWVLDKVEVVRADSGAALPFASHSWPYPAKALGTLRVAVAMAALPKGSKDAVIIHLIDRARTRRVWYTLIPPKS